MKRGLIRTIVLSFWILLGLVVLLASFDYKIGLNDRVAKNARLIFPEGWGFFTKNPQEAMVDVYKVDTLKGKLDLVDLSNVAPENYYGFSRTARVKGYELSQILAALKGKKWSNDKSHVLESHIADSAVTIKFPGNLRLFKNGVYLFKYRKPVPWSWSGRNQERYTPFKTIKVILHE